MKGSYNRTMEISQEEQAKFAKAILPLVEKTHNANDLTHLYELTTLFRIWTGKNDSISFELSSYTYELLQIAKGQENDGWKDDYKEKLYKQIGYSDDNDG